MLPCGILHTVDAGNAVADLESSFRGRSVFEHPSNNGRLIVHGGIFVMHHVDRGEENDGQQDIHGRPGDGDEEAVPAGMIHELARIVGTLVHGIFAAHLDVAAEREWR